MGTLSNLNGITEPQIPASIARDAEVASAIAAHNIADWAHIEYLWRVFLPRDRGGHYVGYITDTEVASLIANHTTAVDPHPGYLTQTEGDGLYRRSAVALTDADIPTAIARDAEVTSAIANHTAAVDPHPGYLTRTEGDGLYRRSAVALTDADIPAAIARDAEVTSAIANHAAAIDPHPTYLTQTEGDGLYRRSAVALTDADIPAAIARDAEVTSAIANHAAAADPHPVYIKCARINVPVTYNGTNLIQQFLGFHSSQILGLTATCHMSGPSQNWVIPPGGYANGVPPIPGLPSQQVQTVESNDYSLAAGSSAVQIILRQGAFNIGQVMTFKILAWHE